MRTVITTVEFSCVLLYTSLFILNEINETGTGMFLSSGPAVDGAGPPCLRKEGAQQGVHHSS